MELSNYSVESQQYEKSLASSYKKDNGIFYTDVELSGRIIDFLNIPSNATIMEKKRITAREKDIDGNPKYAMRCFLLSLGFIGDEYKAARKVLLSRLEGNSSWKGGKKMEVSDSE